MMRNNKKSTFEREERIATPLSGDEVVISGMSGVFPKSRDVLEFRDNLYNKANLVQLHGRLGYAHPEMPAYTGIIPDINKFDGGFFGVHERQSDSMDAIIRVLQEKAVEAIFDAGMHPSELEGTRTGVYVAAYSNESEKEFCSSLSPQNFVITGYQTSMIAHRLSYFLKLEGPSTVLDTGCSTSLYALENAYRAIRLGEIDNAIVGGAQSCLNMSISMQLLRLGALSKDDTCKPFDDEASGYVRSEAVGVVVLQKKKDSRRVYAHILHAKTNCDGYKEEGIAYPSKEAQSTLITEVHEECGVKSDNLGFMEIHGTATKAGDPEECAAIDEAIAIGRREPILVGSVKSNIGHTEVASGLCSLIKCILTLETGYIPANINFNKPKDSLTGLIEGRIKVVVDTTPLGKNALIGLKNIGIGGSNAYVLLKGNEKNKVECNDSIPRLVFVSGRTKQAITVLFNQILNNGVDVEYIKLLHEIFKKDIQNHVYRGYVMVSKLGEVSESLSFCSEKEKSLYIAFGELENWYDVGRQLMPLPTFSNSIHRIQKLLIPKGVQLLNTLLGDKPSERYAFPIVGAIAVQVAIVDLLKSLDIKANKAFAYSSAKLVLAYYNKVLTLDETINCAFILNSVVLKTNGACRNISPDILLRRMVDELSLSGNENIDGIKINQVLSFIITDNEISEVKDSGVPSVVLQVGKKNLGYMNDCSIIPLFGRERENYLEAFLDGLGRLYLYGYNPQISRLYPQIDLPVGRGIPMVSPFIRWKHNRDKYIPKYSLDRNLQGICGTVEYSIDLANEKWAFIAGHKLGGRIYFPVSGYLYMVSETFASMNKLELRNTQVSLDNIKFIRTTIVPANGSVIFRIAVNIHGNFDVFDGDSKIVTGRIKFLSDYEVENCNFDPLPPRQPQGIYLNKRDVYKEFCLRGYNFSGKFQAIEEYNSNGGYVKWEENWITFIENMLQLQIMHLYTRSLCMPIFISKVNIAAVRHCKAIAEWAKNSDKLLPVHSNIATGEIRSGAILVSGLMLTSIPKPKFSEAAISERYEFIPNHAEVDLHKSVRINMQIILENTLLYKIKVVELIDEFTNDYTEPLTPIITELFGEKEPLVQVNAKILSQGNLDVENKLLNKGKDYVLIIASKILNRPDSLNDAFACIKENGFIISRENSDFDVENLLHPNIVIVTVHKTSSETILLLQKQRQSNITRFIKIDASKEFLWVSKVQEALKTNPNDELVLYAEEEPTNGILGFVNCLRTEPEGRNVRCVYIMNETEEFNPNNVMFSKQLRKNMAINIYKNGQWGTYRHLLINVPVALESGYNCENAEVFSLKYPEGNIPKSNGKLVYVHYCSLGLRDVAIASGQSKANLMLQNQFENNFFVSLEFSGRDERENCLMGITWKGAFSSFVYADSPFVYMVPETWTLEEAATVPVAYTTAIYALIIRGQIKKGESILIHCGDVGVTEVSIRLALHYGCEIFLTIDADTKEQVLKMFPQLKDKHVCNSHGETFEQMVYEATNGRGVDIVLNSLLKTKLDASVRCLARGGRFLEMGEFDLASDNYLSLQMLKKEASLHNILLDNISNESQSVVNEIKKAFEDGLLKGVIKPLKRTIFNYNEIEQALEFITSDAFARKVLINVCNKSEKQHMEAPAVHKFHRFRGYRCDPQKVYIIAGGLGGFGLELANWLVFRGAKKLALGSRRGISTGYQNYRIKLWELYGVVVKVLITSFATKEGCQLLIEEAQQLGTIAAIFNLAVVLVDSSFENQTPESFRTCFMPKAVASQHLDDLSRVMCQDLEDFVVFSSICCGRGNVGQTNYGMANSVMERICEKRKQDGYPALAIQWAAIGQVGIVAEVQVNHQREVTVRGTAQQPISSCLEVLDVLLHQRDASIVISMMLEKKPDPQQASNVVGAVLNVIGLPDSKYVNYNITLAELGLDSVLAVQVLHLLEREFELCFSTEHIRRLTLKGLQDIQNGQEIVTNDIYQTSCSFRLPK